MKKLLYVKTFGCQMNEYDSDKIGQLLNEKNDVDLTDSPDEADLIVLIPAPSVKKRRLRFTVI